MTSAKPTLVLKKFAVLARGVLVEHRHPPHSPADTFNLVTAIETQYYWPDLPNDMREIFRVLKPGGTLAVIAETYKGGNRDVVIGTVMRLFGSPSLGVKEHRDLFLQAGYTDVEVYEERKKGWICVTGQKTGQRIANVGEHVRDFQG